MKRAMRAFRACSAEGRQTTASVGALMPGRGPERSPYFTGTIRCSYGVLPHMIHGFPDFGSLECTVGSSLLPPNTMTWGGSVSHFSPAAGLVANGSLLLAVLPPWSM